MGSKQSTPAPSCSCGKRKFEENEAVEVPSKKSKRKDIEPEVEVSRMEQLRKLADDAGDKKGTSPFMDFMATIVGCKRGSSPLLDFMIDHQSAFEDSFLPWLDCYDYRNLGRVCRTLRHVFKPTSDATWNILVTQLKLERDELVKKIEKETNKKVFERNGCVRVKDQRLVYLDANDIDSPWERVWLGQAVVAERKEKCFDFRRNIILEEFTNQFGDSNIKTDPRKSPVVTFRKLWLLPLFSIAKQDPNQELPVVFTDHFVRRFAEIVEANVVSLFDRAQQLANYNQRGQRWSHNHILKKGDVDYLQHLTGVFEFVCCYKLDFPLPYNHRIARRLSFKANVVRIENKALEEVWRMVINISLSLLKAMVPKKDANIGHMWCPNKKNLLDAAKSINLYLTGHVWDDSYDSDTEDPFEFSREAIKRQWKECTLQEKMDMHPVFGSDIPEPPDSDTDDDWP